MKNYIGKYISQGRIKKGWNYGQLAREIGYRNIAKGIRKLCALEREGYYDTELLKNTLKALELDLETARGLIEKERKEILEDFEIWASEPVPLEREIIVRVIPGIFCTHNIPDSISNQEDALEYARQYALGKKKKVWYEISRKKTARIDEKGKIVIEKNTPDTSCIPQMRLK